MNAAALTPTLWFLTAMAWISFVVLGWAAIQRPRITSLTERTVLAFVLAVLGTVASLLRYNTDTGFAIFPQAVATLIFAVTMLAVLAVPLIWLLMFIALLLGNWWGRRR